jgi:hypothetical protein
MKKGLLALLLVLLVIAYLTKPDDKTCIIEGVRAVWGSVMPDVNKYPGYFEQFMNVNSVNVEVKDRFFFKQVNYRLQKGQRTVAFGAFKNVFAVVRPVALRNDTPPMPGAKR